MITVPQATKKIVERSRYLTEAISKGIINYSSLSRYIKPELEQMLYKPVSEAAILMALTRLEKELQPKFVPMKIFETAPDIIVRSNLIELSLKNSERLAACFVKLFEAHTKNQSSFFTVTEGLSETGIIVSRDLEKKIKEILQGEEILFEMNSLSAITIRMPKENITTPGVYYFFLKSLAWEGINIIETISTPLEISLILEDKDISRAFEILKSLFGSEQK
jgi:aspartokinase